MPHLPKIRLLLLSVSTLARCKKEAPYIDSMTGMYEVSGSTTSDIIPLRSVHDTVVAITKLGDQTLQFIGTNWDTTFMSISLAYNRENTATIAYTYSPAGHSPNGASIFFHRPPVELLLTVTYFIANRTFLVVP